MIKICGECGSKNSEKTMRNYTFSYGIKDDQVEITSVIPVHTCNDCGFAWYDYEAEEIMDTDVEKYLKKKETKND